MSLRPGYEVDQATSAVELAAIRDLRGDPTVADEDGSSWHFVVRHQGSIIAATRVTWGGAGLSPRQIEELQLEPWLAEVPAERIAVRERTVVAPDHPDRAELEELLASPREPFAADGVVIVFSACEPDRLSLSVAMGQHPYAAHNINSTHRGYRIPLVAFVPDEEATRGCGLVATDDHGEPVIPECVAAVVAGSGRVTSWATATRIDYLRSVRDALRALDGRQLGAFDGFVADEIRRCLGRSNIIECERGDHLLHAGASDCNISIVLSGTVEARDAGQVVRTMTTGDTFGEIAFLLDLPRTLDVYAATDDVRVLNLSEAAIREMIEKEPTVAAKLLLNVSRMLCARLIRSG